MISYSLLLNLNTDIFTMQIILDMTKNNVFFVIRRFQMNLFINIEVNCPQIKSNSLDR